MFRVELSAQIVACRHSGELAQEAAVHKIAAAYGELLATVEPAVAAPPQLRWVLNPCRLRDNPGDLRR